VKRKIKFQPDIKISLIYIVLGALWILFSDKVLHAFVVEIDKANRLEIYKGWFFVAITGILLYLLINKELYRRTGILRELEKAIAKSEESDKLKTAFLNNISHYLRTPMNSILGFVDLLKNRNLDDEKREKFLSIVNEQSNHLLQFINSIIEISKIQEGQIKLNIKEFSLNALLRKIQFRYQTEIEFAKKNNSLKITGSYSTDIILKNDVEIIEYILTNLLSNSVKFSTTGEIRFGYQTNKNEIEFFVLDTGCGIPFDKQELITKTFMLSDSNVNIENVGVGLGLAITSGFVKLLKGRLWLEKSNANGTEFRFTIPKNLEIVEENLLQKNRQFITA